MKPSRVIQFLHGNIEDHLGRSIQEIREFSDERIERSRDVIEWMFPTDIRSKSNPNSPILTEFDCANIQSDTICRFSVKQSLDRMVRFYESNDFWITQRNHNFLRLSRILRCIWLFNLKHDYCSLQRALDDVYTDHYDIIGEKTFTYWKMANNIEWLKEQELEESINQQTEHTLERFL